MRPSMFFSTPVILVVVRPKLMASQQVMWMVDKLLTSSYLFGSSYHRQLVGGPRQGDFRRVAGWGS